MSPTYNPHGIIFILKFFEISSSNGSHFLSKLSLLLKLNFLLLKNPKSKLDPFAPSHSKSGSEKLILFSNDE